MQMQKWQVGVGWFGIVTPALGGAPGGLGSQGALGPLRRRSPGGQPLTTDPSGWEV